MATPDLPEAAVEAAVAAWTEELTHWGRYEDREVVQRILAAAAPHLRAQFLAEVDAALRSLTSHYDQHDEEVLALIDLRKMLSDLADTLGAGGDGEG